MKKSMLLLFAVLVTLTQFSCSNPPEPSETLKPFPNLSGTFLGQMLPDSVPELFAPGVVSTGMFTRDVAISPDGEEPVGDQDIWLVERNDEGWGLPQNLGEPVNTDGGEFFPSLTNDGTLYFTRNEKGSNLNRIFRSRWVDGKFQEPELLPEQVNCGTNRFNAFVAPDESYMIVPAMGMPDAYDGVDYYMVFRDPYDRWSEPVNMGELVNGDNARGWSPYVSPGGEALFFMATRTNEMEETDWNYENLKALNDSPGNGNADIYWVNAGFFRILKEKAVFN